MSRKTAVLLAALALVMGLVIFLLFPPERIYEITYVGVAAVGLVLSVFYLTTWGVAAIKAARNGRLRFGSVTVLEFVIVPILAVPSFGTALWNVLTLGFTVVPDGRVRISRLIGLVALFAVVLLRNLNWVRRWRDREQQDESVQEAVSDHNGV